MPSISAANSSAENFSEMQRNASVRKIIVLAGLGSLLFSAGVFVFLFSSWLAHSYIWIDEAFTLFHTDPRLSPIEMQANLATETNPPLHFWLLNLIRHVIVEPRAAGLTLNISSVCCTCGILIWLCYRVDRLALGLLVTTVYLLSAATIFLSMEIRPAPIARDLCVLAAVLAATVRLKGGASFGETASAAVIGALAGISHVYGALFVGAVAAALLTAGLIGRERSMQAFGLVLGGACTMTFGLWWCSINWASGGNLKSIAWLKDFSFYEGTIQFAFPPFFGAGWSWMIVTTGIVVALASPIFRRSISIWLVTAALFLIIPLMVSLRVPIVYYRYYVIEAPAFHVLFTFVLYDLLTAARSEKVRADHWGMFGAGIALAVAVVSGPLVAQANFKMRMEWSGARLIAARAGDCPSKTIRVVMSTDFGPEISRYGYNFALKGTGLNIADASAETKDVSDINCRIVGWMEHAVTQGIPAGIVPGEPTEQVALKALNLTNREHVPLFVERHMSGFVIVKSFVDQR